MTPLTDQAARRILHMADWNGPWERLSLLFWGIRPDSTLRWEIPVHPGGVMLLLTKLGDYCDCRDIAWHHRHVARGTMPWRIWQRKESPMAGSGAVNDS